MDSQTFYRHMDTLYETAPEQIEEYLQTLLKTDGLGVQLLAMNELIGYYRSRSLHQQAIDNCFKAIKLCGELGILQEVQGATTLLNCATAFKAAGDNKEASILYERCQRIYDASLDQKDIRYASIYNNMSALFQKNGEFSKAIESIEKALGILNKKQYPIEWATSMSNLGGLYLDTNPSKASSILLQAQEVFIKYENPHYGVCKLYLGRINRSIEEYEQGLAIIKHYYGENDDFNDAYLIYLDLLKEKKI